MATKTSSRRYAAKKSPAAAKQIATEIHAQLAETVNGLVTSDAWPKLLKAMVAKDGTELSRFSFNNMLLLLTQCPDATAVVTAKAWAARGRWIRKGSKALRVSSPIAVKDERRPDEKKIVGFRLQAEFDVSQTEPMWQDPAHEAMFITPSVGRPSVVKHLRGAAPADMWDDIAGQIEKLGYTIEHGNTGTANGYTDPKTMTVRVSDRVSPAQQTKTLAHELGHILADHVSDMQEYQAHRDVMETVAESFSYMVCALYGMDSASYAAPYIAAWAGKDPEKVMDAVQQCGKQVLAMFRSFVKDIKASKQETLDLAAA
jgi:hypothetical protein